MTLRLVKWWVVGNALYLVLCWCLLALGTVMSVYWLAQVIGQPLISWTNDWAAWPDYVLIAAFFTQSAVWGAAIGWAVCTLTARLTRTRANAARAG